jgi:hypothetical protein
MKQRRSLPWQNYNHARPRSFLGYRTPTECRTLRTECLGSCCFESLADAAQQIEAWRRDYNGSRPHRALQERTPIEFASGIAASRDTTALQTAGG